MSMGEKAASTRESAEAAAGSDSGFARVRATIGSMLRGPDGGSVEEAGDRGRKVGGGGWSSVFEVPPEFEAPSNQVCGLWPFSAGSSLPPDGAILGRHQLQMAQVCADPVTWFRMGRILNPSAFVLGRPGLGKALDLETEVPTPTGIVKMGDLSPGDFVLGSDGRPTPVVAVSEVMEDRECIELEFSDGSRVVADADHLWVTETVADRKREMASRRSPAARRRLGDAGDRIASRRARSALSGSVRVRDVTQALGWDETGKEARVYRWAKTVPESAPGRYEAGTLLDAVDAQLASVVHDQRPAERGPITTREIAATLVSGGKRNHAVLVSPPVDFGVSDEGDLPVDPYLLGVWLGDGSTGAPRLACADSGIITELRSRGIEVEPRSGAYAWRLFDGPRHSRVEGLPSKLRELGVYTDKHVPQRYLRASEEARRDVLAGLLDTDGTVSPAGGQIQFTSTNERLAEACAELAASLGYRPTVREGRARLNGQDCGPQWTVGFTTTEQVFRLARKNEAVDSRSVGTGSRTRCRYVVAARRVPSRRVRCIQVGADDGMFLVTRRFIATHNSTLIRRIITFLGAKGVVPMILSDLKPDYVKLIKAMGGEPITLGRGGMSINPLDPGPAVRGLPHMDADQAKQVRAQLEGRRLNTLAGLCELVRGEKLSDYELTALRTAIRVLDPDLDSTPLVDEVGEVIESRHEEVRRVIRDRGSNDRYDARTERLIDALQGVGSRGAFGDTFARHTSVPMWLDRAIVFDMSEVDDNDLQLQAALQLVCWSYGSAVVQGAKTLAAAGLEPERIYLLVMDELWRVLRASLQMVDRIDAITRLNRQLLLPQIMCTHTMEDLRLATEEATAKAWGFVERSEMVYLGGLAPKEMGNLDQVFAMPEKERSMITTWSDTITSTGTGEPAGLGLFLLKLGSNPGIPFHLDLMPMEKEVNETNERWQDLEKARRESETSEASA